MIRPWNGEAWAREQLEKIFWEMAPAGSSEAELHIYLGAFLEAFPQWVKVAWEDSRMVGYLVGAIDTVAAFKRIPAPPYADVFMDIYARYPAHFHVSCPRGERGHGVGTMLVKDFETTLKELGVTGVHVITHATAKNVDFYRKHGYQHRVERLWEGVPLLFLGKALANDRPAPES